MPEAARLDEIVERIFHEVRNAGGYVSVGDLASNYLSLPWNDDVVRAVVRKVDEKIAAFAEAAAEHIFAEAAGDEGRAYPMLREFKGTGVLFHRIDGLVQSKFRQRDNDMVDSIVERVYRDADGDRALGYELAQIGLEEAGKQGRYFETMVRDRLKAKFVEDRIKQIGDGHPFGGKRAAFRWIYASEDRRSYFNDVGIEADGQLNNPNNYPEDQLRVALRRAAADQIEKRKEASARSVKTRERRHTKLIHSIANGINSGKKYGPAHACVCCRKALTDPVSIDRGVGPECWDRILRIIEDLKDRKELPHYGLSDPGEASS